MDSKHTPTDQPARRAFTAPDAITAVPEDLSLEELAAADPAEAPDLADRLADRLGAMLDGTGHRSDAPHSPPPHGVGFDHESSDGS